MHKVADFIFCLSESAIKIKTVNFAKVFHFFGKIKHFYILEKEESKE
jgi:hypothetical protein